MNELYQVIKIETGKLAFCPFINNNCNDNCVFFSAHEHITEDDIGTFVCLLTKDYKDFMPSYLKVKRVCNE